MAAMVFALPQVPVPLRLAAAGRPSTMPTPGGTAGTVDIVFVLPTADRPGAGITLAVATPGGALTLNPAGAAAALVLGVGLLPRTG